MKKLVIVGTGGVANIMSDYFMRRPDYQVVAFAVDKDYIKESEYKGLPVVPFEDVEKIYSPETHEMFVAVGYLKLNHIRARFYNAAKKKGYTLATYVHPSAIVHPTVEIGDNCFIFELNNIQFKSKIGNNVILWSSNHIGHETVIRDHVYIASHVVISGYCDIGENCFIGVNATFADEVKLGNNCLVGMGATIAKSTEDRKVFVPSKGSVLDFEKLSPAMRKMYEPPED